MNITKKFDRAFQWAGEKMGGEIKTTQSDDFKQLEMEMALRFDGMDRLQKSMSQYVKWAGRRLESSEDKEKNPPAAYLGRTMVGHGEEFQADSEFGNCLITMGRANERVSAIQEAYVTEATSTWLESVERSLAMMKEYQAARKKLESRRLALDASTAKMQKARRDDYRVEEELRTAKAKYEESSEDVARRMQDIRDAEADSVRGMTQFLDAELDYHERCAEELRRVRQNWPAGGSPSGSMSSYGAIERRPTVRSRSNTAQSYSERAPARAQSIYEADEYESTAPPVRMPTTRSRIGLSVTPQNQLDGPARVGISKASTFQGGATLERERVTGGRISSTTTTTASGGYGVNQNVPNVGALRGQLRPVNRIVTSRDDVFGDREDDTDDTGSPDWTNRSTSPATSVGSLSRITSQTGTIKKAPPPPPPSRSKKPAPPVPARREINY